MKKQTNLAERRKEIKQEHFLNNFKLTGILTEGAEAAGVSRQTVYYWIKTSPSFVSRIVKAQEECEQRGYAFRLTALSLLAQSGDREIQDVIRNSRGPRILKKVMDGKCLTVRGVKG